MDVFVPNMSPWGLGCRFPISNPTGGFNNRISQAVKKLTGLVVYFWGTPYMSNMSRDMQT